MTKQIKVNHKLYGILLLIACLFFVCPLIILICNLDNSSVIAIASCVTGVGGGGIASVVVAWLIDMGNCAKSNKELQNTKMMILQQLLFEAICFCSALETATYMENKEKLTWKEWAAILFAQLEADGMTADKRDFLASKVEFLLKELNKIVENKVLYLSLNVLSDEEFIAAMSARTTVDLIFSELNRDDLHFELLDSALDDLKKDFDKLPYISLLNKAKYCEMSDLFTAIGVL